MKTIIKIGEVITPWINAANSEFYMNLGLILLGLGVFTAIVRISYGMQRKPEKKSFKKDEAGFTLLELLTVMAIIVALAAMILAGVGHAQKKSAMERAKAEMAALSVAIESYKIDNGDFPKTPQTDAVTPYNEETGGFGTAISGYVTPAIQLLTRLEGKNDSGVKTGPAYFEPKTDMLATGADRYMLDPFGNPYGYSTKGQFNPTFDLWCTNGLTANPPDTKPTNSILPLWSTNW